MSRSSSGSLGLGAAGLVLWVVAVRQADFLRMGSLGLVTVLGWPYFVGLGFVVAGTALELLRTPLRANRLIVLIIVLVVFLYGTACAVEPVAALGDSWLHAGFVQYVFQHGHALNNYDARFSWPGGFSLGAVLVAFAGQSNALDFLRWFPLVVELLYLAPLVVIARSSGVGRRAAWLGVALFYATNWIYQDYFSPQALNYLFFLVVLATVLATWEPRARLRTAAVREGLRERVADTRASITRLRLGGHEATAVRGSRTTLGLLGLLGLLCLASAISHQLTPFALILALVACLLTRRLARPELIVVAALVAVGWLSLGASNYWIGHLSDIFGSIGHLSSTFGSNVTSRVTGSASHRLVVDARILAIIALYLLAGVGILRRSPNSRSLEVLAGAPFLLLVVQDYGGEGLLRAVLFSLPFTCLLAASAILPNRTGPIRPLLARNRLGEHGRTALRWTVAVVVVGFCLATTVVRGGNDAFEAFSSGELAAVNFAYDHVQSGQTIGMVAPYLPCGQRDIGSVQFFVAADVGGNPTLRYDRSELLRTRPAFIILSQSQEAWGEIVAGYPRRWESSLENALVRDNYRIAARWPTATVLRYDRTT
jgi:hypothetical protein